MRARPAVDRLDLDIPSGTTCVLIGPSGCGKTTTMRIVNRLIEPTSGRIVVEGEDVTRADPIKLRRRIGYVIQQVGLFPHMTIADNIATVPQLLGWPAARIGRRVEEMLSLVGLEPQYLTRYPRHLSGGQRQRVGVARALAADPPVMLMDEPFGAVDPIVRTRLQSEFLGILRGLRKTVIFVTHDIDEAIRMGDLIAIMRDGSLVQCDPPERLLAAPKNQFIAEFVGADRALKRLALITAGAAADPDGARRRRAGRIVHDVIARCPLGSAGEPRRYRGGHECRWIAAWKHFAGGDPRSRRRAGMNVLWRTPPQPVRVSARYAARGSP